MDLSNRVYNEAECRAYLERLIKIHHLLGIEEDYGIAHQLPAYFECTDLVRTANDLYGRDLYLTNRTAAAWLEMQSVAMNDGVSLIGVSGFRSVERQQQIIQRKLTRGQTLAAILKVNAAPGFSQHYSGCVLDLTDFATRETPLEESFEDQPSFEWLVQNASRFGFRLEYQRSNSYGFIYEPWHWVFSEAEEYSISPPPDRS